MREICTSGSVGGEGGNLLAYPACVRTTGKEDDRENELKPFVAVQRVRLPRGKGQPASRKQALHVCGNVTREAYGSRCRSCVLAPKSAIAEAFAVNAAGAAST